MDRWTLELRADAGGDVPPEIRMRRLLKYAGRVCRLHCVGIRPADPQQKNGAADPAMELSRPSKHGGTYDDDYRSQGQADLG